MSGRGSPGGRGSAVRVQVPLLDRLIDDAPDQTRDPPQSVAESMAALRLSVRRDLESLLNARRYWRSWPAHLTELAISPLGFGIPDFASGAFNDPGQREELRVEIETAIKNFEPRFLAVHVHLVDGRDRVDATLNLRIEAMLHAEPAPEAITFDTVVDPTTDNIQVRANDV